MHQIQGGYRALESSDAMPGSVNQKRSFSSSEEERSTPECPSDEQDESEKGKSMTAYLY